MTYYRNIASLTTRDAAAKMGISKASIFHWEHAKHVPTRESLDKMAKAYQCEVSDFFAIDVETLRIEVLSVLQSYFRDPNLDISIDNRASVAARVLVHIAKRYPETETETETETATQCVKSY